MKNENSEWPNIEALRMYVRECNKSMPGDTYTIGDISTGKSLTREGHNQFRQGILGTEKLKKMRFVQSFSAVEAQELLNKLFPDKPKIKIMHNFTWYARRLKFLENNKEYG